MAASKKRSLSLKSAKSPSSKRNGAQRAAANGQPITPPTANQNMPCEDFSPPRQFMKAAAPSIAMYIAKVEGRKAVLALKLPGLVTVAITKKRPIRGFSVVLITRKRRVWQRAQEKPRT